MHTNTNYTVGAKHPFQSINQSINRLIIIVA